MLKSTHDDLGHQAAEKTAMLASSRFYWPGLMADVADYCRKCGRCTLAKAGKKLHGTISSLTATRQLEILAVDFTLLARSTGGIENVPVLGCHGNDNVDLHVIKTLIYSRIILGKVTKFGGPSLDSFEVIQLFSGGEGLQRHPSSPAV